MPGRVPIKLEGIKGEEENPENAGEQDPVGPPRAGQFTSWGSPLSGHHAGLIPLESVLSRECGQLKLALMLQYLD